MKVFSTVLILLFLVLQYKLWCGHGGVKHLLKSQQAIAQQHVSNDQAKAQNQLLTAQVRELQSGYEVLEEHARYELAMVKKGEAFYRVVQPESSQSRNHER